MDGRCPLASHGGGVGVHLERIDAAVRVGVGLGVVPDVVLEGGGRGGRIGSCGARRRRPSRLYGRKGGGAG